MMHTADLSRAFRSPARRTGRALLMWLPVLCGFGPALPAAAGPVPVITAAIPHNAPPEYQLDDQGRPAGLAVETMELIAQQAGVRVRYRIEDSWEAAIQALRDGRADLIPCLGITPDRQREFAFSAPLETLRLGLFVRRDTDAVRGLPDLAGRKVAVVKVSAAEPALDARSGLRLSVYPDFPEALFALLSGHVAALAYPEPWTWKQARDAHVQGEIRAVGEPLTELKSALAVRAGNRKLLARLSPAVDAVLASQQYREVQAKWAGAPEPFWTVARLAWAAGIALLLVAGGIGAWHQLVARRLNRNLRASLAERQQIVQTLRAERDFTNTVLDTVGAMVVVMDREGQIVCFNRACVQTTGFSAEQALGRHVWDFLLPPEQIEPVKGVFAALAAGQFPNTHENDWLTRDGQRRLITWSNTALLDAQGNVEHVIATGIDITERKQVEEELKEEQRLLCETQRIAHIGSWMWDIATSTLAWSQEMYRVYGVTPADFTPSVESFLNLIHPDDRAAMQAWIEASLRGDEPGELEIRIVTPSGETRVLSGFGHLYRDMNNRPLYAAGTAQDITDRKRAKEALAGANQQLRELLTNMADGFVRLDRNWRYTFVNKRASQLLGQSAEQLIGKSIWEEFPETVDQPCYHAYQKSMAEQIPSQIQCRHPPRDRWFEHRVFPSPEGISVFFEDFTERKQSQAEREKLLDELTVRNAEMEDFVYTISHDLKSPLISIGGFSSLLERDTARGDSAAVADSVAEIKKAVEQMQAHIHDLLLLSRTGRASAEMTDVPLAALLDEVIGQFGRRLEIEGTQLTITPGLPTIRADRSGFMRVFTNLMDNALKYRRADVGLRIEIGWQKQESMLLLFIRDNGRGIKKEYQQRIFGLFQRADSSTEGTGVGLAISKRVVEAHGGRIWVESEPDQGSTFWIGLPETMVVEAGT